MIGLGAERSQVDFDNAVLDSSNEGTSPVFELQIDRPGDLSRSRVLVGPTWAHVERLKDNGYRLPRCRPEILGSEPSPQQKTLGHGMPKALQRRRRGSIRAPLPKRG